MDAYINSVYYRRRTQWDLSMPSISSDPASCRLTDSNPRVRTIADLPPPRTVIDSYISKIVERKLRSNNFHVLRWSLDSLEETNGYMGSYHTLSITVRTGDKSEKLKFFAKTPPPTFSPQYDWLIISGTFKKEIRVYEELIPAMGNGIGHKWSVDYYHGKDMTIIVLEDAKESGYVMPDKFLPFDEEHCLWMVKTLSAFHSRSLILDEKLRRSTGQTIADLYGDMLTEAGFIEGQLQAQKYLHACVVGARTLVDLVEGLTDQERTRLKDGVAALILQMPKLVESSSKFRNLVCHRDIWANNIMFRRDSDGRPTGCYLIDYQFIRHNPPAFDFLLSLYLNTSRAIRKAHFESFRDVYCDTMSAELAAEGLDMEGCLSRAEFVQSCEELVINSLTYSAANMQVMLLTKDAAQRYFALPSDEIEHVIYGDQRAELVLSQCRSVKAYQTRIIEILEEIKEHLPDNPSDC
nr:uncharacterized protein LOC117219616 [Megalopta genalis]